MKNYRMDKLRLAFSGITHELKILPQFVDQVKLGLKKAEFRLNDRGIKAGDVMILKEWDKAHGYTGREIYTQVTSVINVDFMISDKGYDLISFILMEKIKK